MSYENGGGAFLLPYFIALFTAGIPLMILEFGLGHKFTASAPLALRKIHKKWEWLGWWSVIFVMFGIVMYYTVIISWCLNYLVFSLSLSWGEDSNAFFFEQFLGLSEGPGEIGTIQVPILIGLIIVWVLNWVIVYKGVRSGIELANKIFMPLLFVLIIIMVAWSLSLEGSIEGVKAYLTPDFSALAKPKVWIDAYSQIFFTLSLGFGIMIAYASYLPKRTNLARNAFLTAFINCGFSVIAGFAVFSILGYMAHQTQQPISEVVAESIGLAFIVYPKAISLIPGGAVFGVLFFAALVVAGISSSVSIVEAFTSAVVDKFHWDRRQVVTSLSVLGLLGGLLFTSRGGLFWLDIVDHYLTHFGLVVVGILEVILVAWVLKAEVLRKHINAVSEMKLGIWWSIMIKYFVPSVLAFILIGDLVSELRRPYENYSWTALISIGISWLLVTFLAACVFSWFPWSKKLNHKS